MKYGALLLCLLCAVMLVLGCLQFVWTSTLRERGLILAILLLLSRDKDHLQRLS